MLDAVVIGGQASLLATTYSGRRFSLIWSLAPLPCISHRLINAQDISRM